VVDFKLTEKAIAQIEKIKQEKQKPILRLKVESGGCAGIMYRMLLDEKIGEDDVIIHGAGYQGLVAITMKKMEPFFDEVTLDFEDGLEGRGFVFSNPNAKNACGCGASFRV
jgi:iron-sulfur cluster assembly protein